MIRLPLLWLLLSLFLHPSLFSQEAAWESLGPDEFPAFEGKGPCPSGMGLVSALWADPGEPALLFAGSNTGGLFKSTDGGANWRNVSDASIPIVTGIGSILRDPLFPQRFYMGTGSTSYDRNYGFGVWISNDYGESWHPGGLLFDPRKRDGKMATVRKLLINPVESNILYALVNTDKAALLFRSDDRGKNWREIFREEGTYFFDAEMDPADPETLYIAGRQFYRSQDGGESWSGNRLEAPAGEIIHRVAVAVHPLYPGRVWAMYESGGQRGIVVATSKNQGQSWSTRATHSFSTLSVGQWKMEFALSPADTLTLYAGGIYMHRSTDGGRQFEKISENIYGHPRWMHVDARSMAVYHQHGKDVLYVGHDGGLSVSRDGGQRWTDISGKGLGITQIWGFAYDAPRQRIYAGTQDLGLLVYAEKEWKNAAIYGDVYDGLVHPLYPDTVLVLTHSGMPGMRRTEDGGKTWKHLPQPYTLSKNDRPLAGHPVETDLVIVGYHDVHLSEDFGAHWKQISDFSLTHGVAKASRLSALAIAPSDPNVMYAAYSEPAWSTEARNCIFRTTNRGESWEDISASLTLCQWTGLTDIAIHPDKPDEIWVCASGFWEEESGIRHKIYHSRNGGRSWENLSLGLPNLPVNVLRYIEPLKTLVAGTDGGVYMLAKNGYEWKKLGEGMPEAMVSDLEYDPLHHSLWASTFGRGMYRLLLPKEAGRERRHWFYRRAKNP